jgi:hypothetical protein
MGRTDACAASLGIKGVANPDDHFGFRREGQHFFVENFRAAGGEGVGFGVAEFVEQACFGGFIGIGGVDAVDVGPNNEFIGVHYVGDDGAGKIRTVAAKGGDATIGSCADETGDDRDNASFEERKKNVAAALFGLFEMRLGVTKGIASQDELGGRDGHGGDTGLFEGGGKKPCAETFAKRGQAIEEILASGDAGASGDFVKQIASQELQSAADAQAVILGEVQIMKDIEVKSQDELGLAAGVCELAIGERASDRKKMIGDALHGGDDHGDSRCLDSGANEACGVEHAVRTEKRAAAKLEGDNVSGLLGCPVGAMQAMVRCGGARFRR